MSILFLLCEELFAASPLTQNIELEILKSDLEEGQGTASARLRTKDRIQSFKSFPDQTLLRNQGWTPPREPTTECSYYFDQLKFLERTIQHSSVRAYSFLREGESTMSLYYQIRLWLGAYFLRKFTQIFANRYEGGGTLGGTPLLCFDEGREEVLQRMLKRDAGIYEFLQRTIELDWRHPKKIDFEGAYDLIDVLHRRHFLYSRAWTVAQIVASLWVGSRFSGFIGSISRSRVLTGFSSLAATGGTTLTLNHLFSENGPEFDAEDTGASDPQSLWSKTMLKVVASLHANPHPAVIDSFLLIQRGRAKRAEQLQESSKATDMATKRVQ